jgi:hypothetical protein
MLAPEKLVDQGGRDLGVQPVSAAHGGMTGFTGEFFKDRFVQMNASVGGGAGLRF